jgi:hypothetical protein
MTRGRTLMYREHARMPPAGGVDHDVEAFHALLR